jgi:hypothetical protein
MEAALPARVAGLMCSNPDQPHCPFSRYRHHVAFGSGADWSQPAVFRILAQFLNLRGNQFERSLVTVKSLIKQAKEF